MEVSGGLYQNQRNQLDITRPQFVRKFRMWITGAAMLGTSILPSFVSAQNPNESQDDCSLEMRDSVAMLLSKNQKVDTLSVNLLPSESRFKEYVTGNNFLDSIYYKKWIPTYYGVDSSDTQRYKNWRLKRHMEPWDHREALLNGFEKFVDSGKFNYMLEICKKRNIPPELLLSLLAGESYFDGRMVSHCKAVGIAQFMEDTANWLNDNFSKVLGFSFKVDLSHGIDNRKNDEKSIEAASVLLRISFRAAREIRQGLSPTIHYPDVSVDYTTEEMLMGFHMYNCGIGGFRKRFLYEDDMNKYPERIFLRGLKGDAENALYVIRSNVCYDVVRESYPKYFSK